MTGEERASPTTPKTARETLNRAQSEDELLKAVTDALTALGFRWTHHRRSDRAVLMGHPGVPDIIALRGRFLLALELKTEKGRVTPEQQEWIDAFNEAPGVVAFVLRPSGLNAFITEIAGLR